MTIGMFLYLKTYFGYNIKELMIWDDMLFSSKLPVP